jgi:type IV secretory pathway TrbD component
VVDVCRAADVHFIPRMRDVTGDGMWIRADSADRDITIVEGVAISCLIVEAGVYTVATHGVSMEAVRYDSVAFFGRYQPLRYTGETRTYLQAYSRPVVVGSVMSSVQLFQYVHVAVCACVSPCSHAACAHRRVCVCVIARLESSSVRDT